MRNSATFRIAIWASAGFLVSVGWGIYFATADKAIPIQPTIYTLARLSNPVAAALTTLYPDFAIGLWPLVVANGVTYTLLGLIVEIVRSKRSDAKLGFE